ncbi:unnamed protein product [Caenorhabditis brenneri]
MFFDDGVKVTFQDNDFRKCVICLIRNYQVGAVSSEVNEITYGDDRIFHSMIFTRKSDDSDVLLDIQKHIFELFSKSPYLYFTALFFDIKFYRYLPRVKKIGLAEESVKVEDVEELIRKHSDLQSLIIYKDLVGDISPESNIFQLNVFSIQYPSRTFTDFTDHYKGRYAEFCAQKQEDAQLFLEKWLRKECCDNLKHALIFLPKGQRFYRNILVYFDEKQWDISTMGEMYPYDKEIAYYAGTHPANFLCKGAHYAERFDGKVTMARVFENFMFFSVWDQRPW